MQLKKVGVVVGAVLVILGLQPFLALKTKQQRETQSGSVKTEQRKHPHKQQHHRHHKKNEDLQKKDPEPEEESGQKKQAHIVVIGNEKYLEGAMVMGWSLKKYQRKNIDLICLTTKGQVSQESLHRLSNSGWDRVLEVDGLSERVKKSRWKDSFVKLQIFNFTNYEKVAYWDSDMALNSDPNSVFTLKLPKNEGYPWVIAIGNPPKKHGGKTYFQTGMMVFRPSKNLKKSVWGLFEQGIATKKYNSINARDGMVLRDFFGTNYSTLPKKYSRNIDPRYSLDGVVGIHYRGGWKPWFNRGKPMKKRLDSPLDDTRKDFGYAYLLWWKIYESLHRKLVETEDASSYPEGAHPATHVWMMRGTSESYVQLLSEERDRRLNTTEKNVELKLSEEGQSCSQLCSAGCHAPSLLTTPPNSCGVMMKLASCESCLPGIYTKARNGSVYPGHLTTNKNTCYYNLRLDDRGMPACEASDPSIRRVCPCIV
eukprot:TRINITY_DN19568_c0_g1_i1.p1 TRINITY_DN19568_c0_g1~~TRINITY_DN19568_c0_g1_i1.p1  ORF type:complete len:490 (+),score=36.81 TRINITY_DN19568_c0_g1_i1:30-1472(+)